MTWNSWDGKSVVDPNVEHCDWCSYPLAVRCDCETKETCPECGVWKLRKNDGKCRACGVPNERKP